MTLLFLGWLWDDMTKSSSHIALTTALGLLVLLFLLMKSGNTFCRIMSGFVLVAVGCLEVYAHADHFIDSTWILHSLGNFFFGLVVFFVVYLMIRTQHIMSKTLLDDYSYYGGYENKYATGFKSAVIAGILIFVASFFGEKYVLFVAGAFALFQLYVIGVAIYSTIVNSGNAFYLLFSIVVYIASLAGLVFLFIHFLLPAVFAGILMVIGNTETTPCECRTYDDGYCHLKNRYVSSEECSSCKRFQYPD